MVEGRGPRGAQDVWISRVVHRSSDRRKDHNVIYATLKPFTEFGSIGGEMSPIFDNRDNVIVPWQDMLALNCSGDLLGNCADIRSVSHNPTEFALSVSSLAGGG